MIIKPKDWDKMEETETGSNGLPKGIYIVKIVAVKDITEKQYLEVKFDVVKGENEGIFDRMSGGDIAKWPNQGIYRVSYKEGPATMFFKRFITAVQKSNKNYLWDWDEQSLKNKYFVAVMGEEEYMWEGDLRISVRIQSARSLEALQKGEIKEPVLKKLKEKIEAPAVALSDGDLPF